MTDIVATVGSATYPPTAEVVELSETQRIVFKILDFKNLSDENHVTPSVLSHGFHWSLSIYPHGHGAVKEESGGPYCSVFLTCEEVKKGKHDNVQAASVIRHGQSPRFLNILPKSFSRSSPSWGSKWTREKALNKCDDDGTLTINIDLRVDVNAIKTWKPKPDPKAILTNLYKSQTGADVKFQVNGKAFRTHKCILAMQDSYLAELANESTPGMEIPIDDGTDPDLFENLIRFHYTEDIPPNFDVETGGIGLLKLADKYRVVKLKLLMEGMIVESPTILSSESCLELLFLAETHNCALLREVAMEMAMEQMPEIMTSTEWSHVLKSPNLVNDILRRFSEKGKSVDTTTTHKLDKFGVAALRKRAHEKGLEVDGSRQVLVKRLKEAEKDDSPRDGN